MEEWGAGFAAWSDWALFARRSDSGFLELAFWGLILGLVLGFGGFFAAFRDWRASRLIAWIPTSKAKGTFVGTVELSGKAEIADDKVINANMSGLPCVYLKTVVYELRKSGKTSS